MSRLQYLTIQSLGLLQSILLVVSGHDGQETVNTDGGEINTGFLLAFFGVFVSIVVLMFLYVKFVGFSKQTTGE